MKKILMLTGLLFCAIAFADNINFLDTLRELAASRTTAAAADETIAQEILPPEQAFNLSAQLLDPDTLLIRWDLPANIYLYDDRFDIRVREGGQLGYAELPPGVLREDEVSGKYFVHYTPVIMSVPILQRDNDHLIVEIAYQGCADSGYCYPPMTTTLTLAEDDAGVPRISLVPADMTILATAQAEHEEILQIFFDNGLPIILLVFLGFGILLTFTPCVLPMVPILAGVIIGRGKHISKQHAFVLALVYVLGMALTYAAIGVIAGFIGQGLQAAFQKPWVIIIFSAFFVMLALSMFGFYELRLPTRMEARLAEWRQHQKTGTYIGSFLLGILSALIVSPCVTAPLVGALAYIGQTGDAVLGGLALFSLAIGMGLPLIIAATLGGHLLPKAGAWMETVSAVFGVLLLGVAIWLLERIVPGPLALVLWAALLMISAVYLGALDAAPHVYGRWVRLWKGIGCLLFVYSIILLIGAALGNNDPLRPLVWQANGQQQATLFKQVKSLADVQKELQLAQQEGKPVILDFYADWCAACVKMKRTTFADPAVQQALAEFVRLQADVTANDALDKILQRHFEVYAPPAILFFNIDGQENKSARLVGETGTQVFLAHVRKLML